MFKNDHYHWSRLGNNLDIATFRILGAWVAHRVVCAWSPGWKVNRYSWSLPLSLSNASSILGGGLGWEHMHTRHVCKLFICRCWKCMSPSWIRNGTIVHSISPFFIETWNAVAQKWLHCCTIVLPSLLSPHPADPTLTTENLMEVLQGVERQWEDLADKLNVRLEKRIEIRTLHLSDVVSMEEVVKEYVKYTPDHSWWEVACALQRMGLDQQADTVTTKYIQGILATILCPLLHRNILSSHMEHCEKMDNPLIHPHTS